MSTQLVLIGTASDVDVKAVDVNEVAKFKFTAKDDKHIDKGEYALPIDVTVIIEKRLSHGVDGKKLTWYQHKNPEGPSVAKALNIDFKQMAAIRKSEEWVTAVNKWVTDGKEDEQETRREKADKILLKLSKSMDIARGPNDGTKKGANPTEVIEGKLAKVSESIAKLVENGDIPSDDAELADEIGRKIEATSLVLIKSVKAPSEEARVAAEKAEEVRKVEEARVAKMESDAAKLGDVEAVLEGKIAMARKVMENKNSSKAELLEAMMVIAS